VYVTVDGVTETVRTHRHTTGALLLDLGLDIKPQDRVTPGPGARILSNMQLGIERARPLRVIADGREVQTAAQGRLGQSVREALAEAGILVDLYDRVSVGGVLLALDESLPLAETEIAPTTYDRGYAWESYTVEPLEMRVQRAIPIEVDDGGLPFIIRTTAETVGEALRQAEITLYLGDRVQPSLGSQVSSGLRVMIRRSIPIHLQADGHMLRTRTQGRTVADALTEMKIGLSGSDVVTPSLATELYDNVQIAILRVRNEIDIEEEIIPFETIFQPDANIAIDTQQVVAPGAPGINRQRYHVRIENDQEAERKLQDSWVAQEAAQRVIAYGQRIEPQTYTAPDGTTFTYWRKMRMYATSYSAATAGVSPSAPNYGRTRTGDIMRSGIVAVDPRVVSLRSQVYVAGYGVGDALDTGSGVLGRHIDLGYDDDKLVHWARWVDVYVLWPPPPSQQITWVLPNYPRESN
jgi:uncharacterized protein YabE (DUF348 family)